MNIQKEPFSTTLMETLTYWVKVVTLFVSGRLKKIKTLILDFRFWIM